MSALHASWFCETMKSFIVGCAEWKTFAGSQIIWTGVCPFCSCLVKKCFLTSLTPIIRMPLLKVCLKTYGTVILYWFFIGLSNLNSASDSLYRFRVKTFALSETRQSITHLAQESSYRIVTVKSTVIYYVWYCAFLVSCYVTSVREMPNRFKTCMCTSHDSISIKQTFFLLWGYNKSLKFVLLLSIILSLSYYPACFNEQLTKKICMKWCSF